MANPYRPAIETLQADLREQEETVARTKKLINDLCERAGEAPLHPDATLAASSGIAAIRADEFYGQPLATAVRRILEIRKTGGFGPAAVTDLYLALEKGGYVFETKNATNAKRGIRISLAKNSHTFHKLPGGQFGLLEWYPSAKAPRENSLKPGEAANQMDQLGADDGDASEGAEASA